MRILCVIDELGSGGAQRQLVGLAAGFKQKGHDVSFLVYHEGDFFKGMLDSHAIPVTLILESNYLVRLLKMRRFIRQGRYDAVIAFLEAASFIAEMAGMPRRKWKLIVGERSANPGILKSIKLKFYRWCHVFADYVVANSYANLELVKKANPYLSRSKCKVIYNFIDSCVWEPADDYVPLKNGKLHLIVASSHQHLKNAAGLIEAVHQLPPDEMNKLQISWYGNASSDNSYTNAMRLLQKYGLENVFSFHPATKDIKEKIQYADILGLFSFYEGLPNAVCEAMMLGKVVIASNVSDIPQIFQNETGYHFDPKNQNELIKILRRVLTLNGEDLIIMGRNSRNLALELFSKEIIISKYEKLIFGKRFT